MPDSKNRRLASRLALITALFSVLVAGCQEAPQVFEWRLQSYATQNSSDFQQLQAFTENVRRMSAGRLNITAYPGGAITGGPDIYTAVKEKRIEMGNGWPNWWAGQNPVWGVMNGGPFEFMNLDASMLFFISQGGIEQANKLSAPDGVIWRPAWWAGMEFGLLSKEKITGLDDLKGKRVRIGPGIAGEVVAQATGAFTVPTVPEEIRPALENGELDAVEWTTAAGALGLGLQDISRHAIVPAIWQPSVLSDFLINTSAYEALPDDLQAVLDTAIQAYNLQRTLTAKAQDIAAFNALKAQGVEMSRWSAQDIVRWKEANAEVLRRYQAPEIQEILQQKRTFKQRYDEYYQWFGPYDK